MPVKKPRIGAHTPTTGGMAKRSIAYAQEIGAEAIQVFASSPRTWAMPEAKPDLDEAFKIKAAELDIETYVHAPFLINLGSPTEATYLNSLASTAYSLQRGSDIGALGVVIHTGSAVDVNHVEKAWKQIHEGMMPILNALGDGAPYLLLEPTAGQGQSLVKKLDDLAMYLKALEYHPKVAICLDTCHVFAAGHDILALIPSRNYSITQQLPTLHSFLKHLAWSQNMARKLRYSRNCAANVCSSPTAIKTSTLGTFNCLCGLGLCFCRYEGCYCAPERQQLPFQ